MLHQINFSRQKPKIRLFDERVIVVDPETNVSTFVDPAEKLASYSIDDFDRTAMVKAGIPLEIKSVEMPHTLALEAFHSMVSQFNNEVKKSVESSKNE